MRAFALPVLLLMMSVLVAVEASCTGSNARTQPPSGAIVVDASGSYKGSVKTVSQGAAKLSSTTAQQTLFIFPGTYREQVLIPALNGPLVVQGYTCNTMSYSANQVSITHAMAQKDLAANVQNRNDVISTLRLKSNSGVKIYNINVANTAGNVGQAVATYVDGSAYGFYACKFSGYQDTVCANKGRELYARSYIGGAIDFVFGEQAKAWFESCDIESVGTGCITANGNAGSSNPSEYVFNNARVYGSSSQTAFLGRPWRPYARVVWQNSQLGNVINPKGWQVWDSSSSTSNVFLREFNNTGPGASTSQRVSFSGKLSGPVSIESILGSSYKSEWWVDTNFL
ncbi:pectin methylesterase [Phytophthora cinnamomi]|uniref:pectin methylesterase n=1 Tax=Phytophthora cinnamomi TaxID=4785 RepID=UPI00355AB0F0|nr:pectin methylesterase [Phytophthora cinnamomi]